MFKKWLRCGLAVLALAITIPSQPHAADAPKAHHVAVQIDVADPAVMTLALNNIGAMYAYYQNAGEPVDIEIVAFGPGLAMLRDDISPVKERLTAFSAAHPALILSACENTRRSASRAEGKEVPIVKEAQSVPSGVVRLTELQEKGYSYLRP